MVARAIFWRWLAGSFRDVEGNRQSRPAELVRQLAVSAWQFLEDSEGEGRELQGTFVRVESFVVEDAPMSSAVFGGFAHAHDHDHGDGDGDHRAGSVQTAVILGVQP